MVMIMMMPLVMVMALVKMITIGRAMPSAAEWDKSFSQVSADVGKRDFLLEIAQD